LFGQARELFDFFETGLNQPNANCKRLNGETVRPFKPFYDVTVSFLWGKMARVTGLEPATSGVTGQHSNRLSYTRACLPK
jgi:hypothetical protein